MNIPDDSDYEEWVRRANDPRESEAARAAYRARMEQHVRERLREAFQAARRAPGTDGS